MGGRLYASEPVETPPHRAEFWFSAVLAALSPRAGRGKPCCPAWCEIQKFRTKGRPLIAPIFWWENQAQNRSWIMGYPFDCRPF
jgi:hypothetical protein